jgi:hypothetical protein
MRFKTVRKIHREEHKTSWEVHAGSIKAAETTEHKAECKGAMRRVDYKWLDIDSTGT